MNKRKTINIRQIKNQGYGTVFCPTKSLYELSWQTQTADKGEYDSETLISIN